MPRIVLVARDVAPSLAFEMVKAELWARPGVTGRAYLGHGKPIVAQQDEVDASVRGADIVLIGLSSQKDLAEPEIYAAEEAIEHGVPVVAYSDTFGCFNRPWFADVLPHVAALFVINAQEAGKAHLQFPAPDIITSGNPTWEDFCFPKRTRQEVRQYLGVTDETKVILSPGSKSPVINILLWGTLIEAATRISGLKMQLVFAPHPGDRTAKEIYDDLLTYSPVPVQWVSREEFPASELLPGVDLVVQSASTIGIEAAHLRIPVIDCFSESARGRWREASGGERWEPCVLGVSRETSLDTAELCREISLLLHGTVFATEQRRLQERVYPVSSERGRGARVIADTLLSIAKKE